MFCVGKTGSRSYGGGPPAEWVIHGGPHRGKRPKGLKLRKLIADESLSQYQLPN